ncbi:ABC transporter ATP-binding protein [Actinotalea sp. K2]|uniref:ABC transporter ATP-binding protein n=1 Tax=Actinotalea sp. K2 TaxID=2939438 RepID=UPI0020181784|nr:ATP-binding cassette domain-containing protein [Actinotalea sp. K2]MCL3861781.1 ATP-binding cassette domain-containing protein [Actinotalea sp. K2]
MVEGTPQRPAVRDVAPVVVCDGLVRVYRSGTGEVQALRGIDASFHAGTVTAVAGPSGSGKSSLLRMVAARERPSAGRLELLGQDVSLLRARALRDLRRRTVSFVEQRSSRGLFPHLTAIDQVRQVAVLRGMRDVDAREVLAGVGLVDRATHLPRTLSGGQQQRLAVALALLGPPTVVVADEPTAELDHANADVVLAALRRAASAGSTVVLSSHDEHALAGADRVLRLRHGVVSSEQVPHGEALAMLDSTGRVQLTGPALSLFTQGRARVTVEAGRVVLSPPEVGS